MAGKFQAIREANITNQWLLTAAKKANMKAEDWVDALEDNVKNEVHEDTGALKDAIKTDYSKNGRAMIYVDSIKLMNDSRNLEGFDYSYEYWKGRPAVKGIINRGSSWGEAGDWRKFRRWNGDPFIERAIERTRKL